MQNVENKVILITGASSGIGKATAKLLVKNGAKVALSARREERLQELADELGTENVVYLKSDVTDLTSLQNLVKLAKDKFGKIDAVYANAGIMPAGNMSQMKVNDWMSMVDINVKGVLNSIAAVLPDFLDQKAGQIIVTSSSAGLYPVPGNAVYSGTKYFVRGLMDSFRSEAATEKNHIRSTTIYPGAIQTELLSTVAPSQTKDMVTEFYKNIGIKPIAIAKAVLYAISQSDDVDVSEIAVRPTMEA